MGKYSNILFYSLLTLAFLTCFGIPFILYFYIEEAQDPFATTIQTLRIGDTSWDWLAYIVAVVSLLITIGTLISQYNTQRNTQQVDDLSQQNILKEFTAHFYRNRIVLNALTAKMEGRWSTHYPSEEHLVKLKLDLDPAVFKKHANNYDSVYELQFLTNNFNTEVNIVLMHLKNQNVPDSVKQRDIATLRFKMDFLTKKVTELMHTIWKKDFKNTIVEHIQNTGYRRIGAQGETTEELKNDALRLAGQTFAEEQTEITYVQPVESMFYYQMFVDDRERKDFYKIFNALIHIERNANNNQGYPKILLLPFDKTTHDCI